MSDFQDKLRDIIDAHRRWSQNHNYALEGREPEYGKYLNPIVAQQAITEAVLAEIELLITMKVMAHAHPLYVSEEVNAAIELYADELRAELRKRIRGTDGA